MNNKNFKMMNISILNKLKMKEDIRKAIEPLQSVFDKKERELSTGAVAGTLTNYELYDHKEANRINNILDEVQKLINQL